MKRFLPQLIILLATFFSTDVHGQWTNVNHAPNTTFTYGTVAVTVTGNGLTGGGCGGYYWTQVTGQQYTFTFATPVQAVRLTCDALNTGESVTFYVNGSLTPLNTCNLNPTPYVNNCSNTNCNIVGNTFINNTGFTLCGGVITFYGSITSVQMVQTAGFSGTTYGVQFAPFGVVVPSPGGTLVAGSNNPSCGQTLNLTASGMTGVSSYSWTGPNGFTSNQQNPSIPNPNSNNSGTYTVTAQTICGPVTATVNVIITNPPPPTVTTPVVYCQNVPAVPLTANGTNLLWYTVAVGGVGSNVAPTPNTNVPGSTTWWVSQSVNGCESQRVPITVTITPAPSGLVANSNSPICQGGQLTLTATFIPGATYQWNGPNLFNSTNQNPIINGAQPVNAGTYTVTASITTTVNGTPYTCSSSPSTTVVQVLPNPFIPFASAQSPTTCNGTGQLTLNGLTPNTVYTYNYTYNGNPVTGSLSTNGTGQLIITGLAAGTYTAVSVTLGTCTSNTLAGPYTINNGPVGATIAVTSSNPTTCNGTNGSITITGLTNGQSFNVFYTLNGNPVGPIPTGPIVGGSFPIGNLSAGTYTNIYAVLISNNCQTNTIPQVILADPPTPTVNITSVNPTSCTINNGSITINGLTNGTNYTITYTANGTPMTITNPTITGGSYTINGLAGGTYANITVTVTATNCSAAPVTVNLVGPSAPPAPGITGNGPLCAGATFTGTTTATGVTYNWSGPAGFSATTQNITINGVQVNQGGVYTLTVTANNCASAPSTYNLVVNPSPVKPNAGPDIAICEGQPLNLTSSTPTPGVAYSWTSTTGFTSNQQNPNVSPSATAANSGTYYVTASAAGCTSIPDTVNVTVTPTPSIQFTSTNPTACATNTGSIVLNTLANGTYQYSYVKNGAPATTGSGTVTNNSTLTIGNLGAGTYTNIFVTINGCTSNIVGPVQLVDPNAPAAPVANSNSPICAGDDLNLTADPVAGGAFTWNGPNNFTATTQNPTITGATLAAGGTYTVYVVVNGCTSPNTTIPVVVNPVPSTPDLTGTTTQVCEGDPIDLVSNLIAGVTYEWVDGASTVVGTTQNVTIPNSQTAMSGTYTLTVTNGTCDASNTVAITVNPIPASPVTVDIEACQYETVQLTAQGQNLLWYMAMTGGSGTNTMTANTQTAGVTVCYYVSQTINGCEGPRAPLCVYVKPQPAAPAATQNYVYCQYDPNATQLTATGTNLQWYDNNNTLLPGAPTPSTQVATTLTYYVTQTDSGCESNKTQIDVLINAKPPMPVVEQMTICQDEAAPVLNAAGQNLIWYDSATGGSAYAGTPVITTTDTGVFDYYVSQTVNGCESDRALLRVTVNPKVVAEFITDKDTVCDSYPLNITFTGLAPSTASYDWDFDSPTDVTGSGAGPYVVTWDSKGTKTITLTVTNLNCSSTVSKMVEVLETPDPMFAIQPDACLNEEVRVQSAYDQMDLPGYNWTFDGAQILSGSGYGPYTLKWTTTGQKVISMSLTNIPCPSLPYYDTINIHHPEAKVMDRSNSEICTSDSVLFTAQPGLDYQYGWSPKAWFGEETNSLSIWGVVKKAGYATLTVTDRWGCEASDSVLVEPKSCCEVFLPNTFTPNGDGKNDVFRMVTKGNQEISVFIIMDRWGKRMFESVNQYEGWDGSYNGEAQDMGTYQYYLRYRCSDNGEIVEMKGDVILLR